MTTPISVRTGFIGTHRRRLFLRVPSLLNRRHPLSPFVLSLSKYDRELCLSNPDSIFESIFYHYPSTSFLRQAQDGAGRTD
ncbi:MAG: hypothetical protein LBD67_07850 [Candidatus Accumulibacter sp.]|nr:hypothetical protein [Accumulibacter sp.]